MAFLNELWLRRQFSRLKTIFLGQFALIVPFPIVVRSIVADCKARALLILDDLFLVPLDAKERPILLDIIEDRHGRKSIIITSQLPVSSWYDAVGDPTVADAILDRIVHSAHQIELIGESIRKMKADKERR